MSGSGRNITIAEFAQLVADGIGYRGRLVFDTTRPDGAPQKLLDGSKLAQLGWRANGPGVTLRKRQRLKKPK